MSTKIVSNWIKMFPMTPEPKQYIWARFFDGEIKLLYSFHVNKYGVLLLDPLSPYTRINLVPEEPLISHWRPVEQPDFKETLIEID